ncbi:ribonuclease H-like domain-containing protein [Tanacetum coccineum]|uniref:Ribonuclease H-like domain-containing protein n=1 Tax=Tanacetum coccineum TaxID=301880 RepID=A0ABQ5ADI5_9ASTR
MDTLSLDSKYLNGMEDILDDGDSLEARKLTVEKSKEELELFEALDHKSVIVNEGSHRVVVFNKAPPRAYSKPFTRFSLPCDVDGQDYRKYGRKMVKEDRVEIHGFTFLVDFVVIGYANKGEPSMHIVSHAEEMKDIDVMLDKLVENLEEEGSSNGDLVKMGKASRNKNHKVNKLTPPPQLKFEEIPPISAIASPSPVYHPLTIKTKEKMNEAFGIKLDEVLMGRVRLSRDDYSEEVKMIIVEHGMNALADTGASVSVLPYCFFMNLGLGDPKPYNSNLTMADNTQAKAIGEVKNNLWRVIDMGRSTLCIDDGVIRHTYFPKTRAKDYLDNFAQEEEDDWLSCFKVGRDKDGNPKYEPVAPSFLDIEDDMERALAMEAYSNPFKNIIIFKKLIDFLGSLLVQLKNTDWGNEGHRPADRLGCSVDETPAKATQGSHLNPLIENFKKRNKQGTIKYHLQQVKNANLKWRELQSAERHAYYERLSKLQGVDRTKLMKEKCIWFRLCGVEKVLTLPEFAVLLGLYEEDELNHTLFAIHFTKLEVDDKLFNHEAFWQRIRKPTSTNPRTSLIKEPLMRIVHKLLVGSLVHRASSKERCQKRDMWTMSALEESRGINLAWVIAEHLCKHAPGLKENSLICGGHYVTKIAHSLEYLNEEEVAKCSEPIEYETWTAKMLANELDEATHSLMQTEQVAPQAGQARRQRNEPRGLDSSWGDWNASLNEVEHRDVWRDSILIRNNYMLEHSIPILHHLADQSNFAYPTYEPSNVPPYPYPYVPYPHPYMHYPDTGSPSFGGDHYGAHGDGYHAGSIVPSSGYEIGGSSTGFHGDDFDSIVHSEDCVASDDDEMED